MLKAVNSAEIDLIYHRFRFAVNTLEAVHCAMAESGNEPMEFLDAVYGVADYMGMLLDELKEVYDPEDGRAKSCLL